MNRTERLNEIFRRLSQNIPQPETELVYQSNYELLVAVALSAQATDVSVNLATAKLFKVANTPEKMLELGQAGLENYIKTIGLFRSKAKHVIQCAAQLIERHNGEVPSTLEALQNLSGVGRKTANVILNTAFGQPTIAVDTHVFRVSNRLRIGLGKDVDTVEAKLMRNIPKPYLMDAHHWLILFGRYVCTARNPKCQTCYLYDLCTAKERSPRPE